MKKGLFFDIETIPGQAPGLLQEFSLEVKAPAQYKKPESISEWLRDNRDQEAEKAWLATSFDGGLGQVCVIGFAVNDEEPISYHVDSLDSTSESRLLEHFFCAVADLGHGTRFVGHNVIGFDIRFLWQRAMVLGVRPPACFPRDPKPWSELVFDTMVAWSGVKDRISMNRLCRIFDLEGKGDIDGSKVWPMVQSGRISEVADYCRGDVLRTRAIYNRMTFRGAA